MALRRSFVSLLAVSTLAFGLAALPVMTAQPAPAAAQSAAPPSFEDLAERLLPAVVNISTTSKVVQTAPQLPQFPPGSPFENFFKDFYEQYRDRLPQQMPDKVSALGSGFIIDAQKGYVVTNNHVIKDADEIRVILHDDTSLDATLVGVDEKTDLAVLQVKTEGRQLTAVSWGDSDKAKVGSWVLAIGNPFGLGGTVTAGIVSARQRDINAGPYDDFIQTDASINRGNSGGPMFNMDGNVVGVNTAIFSPTGGSVGIGFSVPSNLARNVVEQLVKYGQTRRGWLGVRIQDVTPEIAEGFGLKGKARGALVSSLTEGSPAGKAGIREGDIILTFDGQDIDAMRKLPRIVAETEVGKKVPVTIWREGAETTLTVELGQMESTEKAADEKAQTGTPAPAAISAAKDIPEIGLSVAPISDTLRQLHGIPDTATGVVVTQVTKDSGAAERGVAVGDVIVEIDQQDSASPENVAQKVAEAKKAGRTSVLMFVARKEDRRFIALRLK
ncbi:MAG TPA: DegQ family serine endoprotease [Alphaproteobacteria bacterium]|nr:serine protease [Rhodospirillaceae bacterium]HRJ66161.1 DegQ family serine endoprotease [Alphaproteobacteria bacterium]